MGMYNLVIISALAITVPAIHLRVRADNLK